MTAKKVTQTAKKAENVKINAPAKTVETAKITTTAVPAAKKEEPKAEALKKEEKAAPVKAEAEKKETVKKETAKKTTARKTAKAEKPAAVHNVYVQFAGKEVLTSALTELVTEKWVAMGHRASSIKTLDLYVKPEDGAAYYVINGKETGKIEL
ncbi:hypothetical protein H8S44_06665 [Anaerosacchariphilus sp. NSJ-68]|uniref:Uncharacterized protein n=2 Tax=Lachnospiraceae TaxID=186803 RepID=A0A923LC45_9FIRM|nr:MULTISPECIES: DUF6465 family protein [Lachnospiraceae]MBC5659450.1 hypothetical protein [Anaerosacchariphilus hominis]MBC5697116.1 hypothetical protein [Roseburia difficilis]